MKIRFLKQAWRDINWVVTYYEQFFPEGSANFQESFKKTIGLLRENPMAGPKRKNRNLRTIPILKTPFRIVYKLAATEIQIARILDMRSNRNLM